MATSNWIMGDNFLSDRASLLKLETIIETAAVDEYVFIRDAYLQKRESDMLTGSFTVGKESGDSQTVSGGGASAGGGALEHLQGPPE